MMADTHKKINPDVQGQEHERPEAEREKREAEISVGIETREAIEGAEIPSGEVSEKEGEAKEGYAGTADGKTTPGGALVKKEKIPDVKVMRKEVERSVIQEMKLLQKKIRHVMEKSGTVDAYQLNGLIANLRKLQEILASLVYATGEFIKDLWLKYVKKEG
jgi:hypothetical protein